MAGNTVLHYAVLLEDDERMCVSLLNANADTMVSYPGFMSIMVYRLFSGSCI
jgi:hypothetical protein